MIPKQLTDREFNRIVKFASKPAHERRKRIKAERDKARRDAVKIRAVLVERYGSRCMCCGCKGFLTIDHIIPVTRGGKTTIKNCQLLCRPCNLAKGQKIIDYRKGQGTS